ncbi:mercury(II) reductase [Sulfurivirga sp.]|uniref:mercury(II) reductase n=1 Tax=Sulfurivirga sp. TaxID=2614236 RepID=UPI0025D12B7D|nr:mercury(II) reductase [Sulfurivirga sp.]
MIIGSGSAAFAAAIELAEAGRQVVMVERSPIIGGTCVNVGCVPSKIMIRQAEVAHLQAQPPFASITACASQVDHAARVGELRAKVEALREQKYHHMLEIYPQISLRQGEARLRDAHTVEIDGPEGRETVNAGHILIATGSRPHVPDLPGLNETPFWTSTELLFAEEPPEHLLVLGAGVVALELAQAAARLGSRVTLIARRRLLSHLPPEVDETLRAALAEEGIEVITGSPRRVDYAAGHFTVEMESHQLIGDRLLVATGRVANTDGLNLAEGGVRTDEHGAIEVNEHMQTNVPGIYAAGDCTTLPRFVYVAAAGGKTAARHMLGDCCARQDLAVLPQVVFTDPQVATVGLTVEQAAAQGIEADSRRLPLEQMPRAQAQGSRHGFVQLVAERGGGRLLGAQIVAPQAGEMIEAAALALRAGMTVRDLAGELMPYLTWAEGLKLCAQTFFKDVSRLSCCAG